jgi:hypothetical protein
MCRFGFRLQYWSTGKVILMEIAARSIDNSQPTAVGRTERPINTIPRECEDPAGWHPFAGVVV